MLNYKEEILKGGYKLIITIAENILLRPNDTKLLVGEEKFNLLLQAEEEILEDYKQDDIYQYYYGLDKIPHGFCNFERWKKGMFF